MDHKLIVFNFNIKHQTHFESIAKFLLLLIVFVVYFIYLSFHHGTGKGLISLALTWSFFVLCTPIADAGFLIDFPIRLIFGLRMFVVEIFVWAIAFSIITVILVFTPKHFQTTLITRLLYQILSHPYPYWVIIFLSFIGTFASIYFGDEMIDVIAHKHREKHHKHGFRYRVIAMISVIILTVTVYHQLMLDFGLPLPNGNG